MPTPLILQSHNGAAAYAADRKFLVRTNAETGKWETVDHFDRNLNTDQLSHGYGLWQDRELTKGHLLFKQTLRPLDDKVQDDEVTPFASITAKDIKSQVDSADGGYDTLVWSLTGHSITGTENQLPNLNEEWNITSTYHQEPINSATGLTASEMARL